MSLMEDVDHVVKVEKEETGGGDGKWKGMFLGAITLIIIAAVGGGAYLIGTKKITHINQHPGRK